MGLVSLALGDSNPLSRFIADNKSAVHGMFAGLGSGQNIQAGLSNAAQSISAGQRLDEQRRDTEKAEAERQAEIKRLADKRARYAQYFRDHGSEDYAMLAEDTDNPEALWMDWHQSTAPKAAEGFTLGPGEQRYGGDGALIASGGIDQGDQFSNEKDLYSQYSGSDTVKNYGAVRDAYERVRQSAAQNNGAGDMGLIYGYMKMLDPGSVVRESEFAMAAQAGSYGEQIQGLVQRVLTGERLPPQVRQEFVQVAEKLYGEAAGNMEQTNAQFTDRATRYGVDPQSFLRVPETYQPLNQLADLKSKYGLE
jgi:hypothetical protein